MTTLMKSAAERAAMLQNAAETPQSDEARVNVLILAGGFNTRFLEDIHTKAAADTLRKDPTVNIIRRTKEGVEHVPAGLQNVGVGGALATVIKHLLGVHQLQPLTQSLYLVTNAANHDEYAGVAAFFDTVGRFPKEWQQRRVLCNGAAAPGEWLGHAADAQMALRAIWQENELDTVVLDANMFFWPDFNLQKLISNMVIRERPSIALQRLTDTDVKLYPASRLTALATLTAPGQVPPIAAIDATPARALHAGAYAMRPLMYLPAASAAAALAFQPSRGAATGAAAAIAAAGLPELAAYLQTHETVYGAIMPTGAFDLTALLPQRYVQQHMLYSAATRRRLDAHSRASGDAVDTITALLQECDDTGLGRSKIMDEPRVAELMGDVLKEQAREFDMHFFAFEAAKFRGYQRPAYNLPKTFYMSTYRQQAAEATV